MEGELWGFKDFDLSVVSVPPFFWLLDPTIMPDTKVKLKVID